MSTLMLKIWSRGDVGESWGMGETGTVGIGRTHRDVASPINGLTFSVGSEDQTTKWSASQRGPSWDVASKVPSQNSKTAANRMQWFKQLHRTLQLATKSGTDTRTNTGPQRGHPQFVGSRLRQDPLLSGTSRWRSTNSHHPHLFASSNIQGVELRGDSILHWLVWFLFGSVSSR
ncbi:hypothetical protein BCR34DRAFT_574344 [Clohesyomyces aquaticus]|uniref:Uncharacterized protein n=1 Tax=Clohesyomyces aquaticus TaxID=1231657 RepID=A0A1Y1YX94_9PLEO|nr:hypothetical protein BCR34DRAFT_574344 [Clohesyomyces aquaticus]